MKKLNIFRNTCKVPEDKATYYFFCMLDHLDGELQKQFFEYLIKSKITLSSNPLEIISFQEAGDTSRPDAKFKLECQGELEPIYIYFENKTKSCQTKVNQINNYINYFCRKKNHYMLVITPRETDKKILKEVKSDRLTFRTWSEVLHFMENILNNNKNVSFLINEFLEYAKKDYDLIPMELITKDDIRETDSTCYPDNIAKKFTHLFSKMSNDPTLLEKYHINIKKLDNTRHWGRHGIEFEPVKREYGQWFFYGIYFDSRNHKIKFKKNCPELAFFFDYDPSNKEKLINNTEFMAAIDRLIQKEKGFEENLRVNKANSHRLLFKRFPLSDVVGEHGEIDLSILKGKFEAILEELIEEEAFRRILL